MNCEELLVVPAGMREVTENEFFATLYADPRDVMPRRRVHTHSTWLVRHTDAVWGWSCASYCSPSGTQRYALST